MHVRGVGLGAVLLAGSLAAATQVPAVAAGPVGSSSVDLVHLTAGGEGWTVLLERDDSCDTVTPVSDTASQFALICSGERLDDDGGLVGGGELAPGTSVGLQLVPDHPRARPEPDDEVLVDDAPIQDPLLTMYDVPPRSEQRLRLPRLPGYTLRWVCFPTPPETAPETPPGTPAPRDAVPAVALDWAELIDPDTRTGVRVRAMLDRCRSLRGSALA